jgi:hypothetical protein
MRSRVDATRKRRKAGRSKQLVDETTPWPARPVTREVAAFNDAHEDHNAGRRVQPICILDDSPAHSDGPRAASPGDLARMLGALEREHERPTLLRRRVIELERGLSRELSRGRIHRTQSRRGALASPLAWSLHSWRQIDALGECSRSPCCDSIPPKRFAILTIEQRKA